MGDDQDRTRAVDAEGLAELRRAARERRGGGATEDAERPSTINDGQTADARFDAGSDIDRPAVDHRGDPSGDMAPAARAERTTAAQFVRSRDSVASNETEDRPPDPPKQRSTMPVIAAVVVGFWIVAGGAFLALRSVGTEEPTDEAVLEVPDELATVGPTPTFAPTATPDPNATPTPVPPTPTWVPATDGPRSTPFTFAVEAIVANPTFYEAQDGEAIEPAAAGEKLNLVNPTASGAPLVLRVQLGEPTDEWAAVELPGTNEIAWVRSEEFVWSSSNRLIQVDVRANELRVFEGNELLFTAAVATGDRRSTTPAVETFVLENAGRFGPVEGTELFRLAAFGDVGRDLDGLPTLSIGLTEDPSLLGRYTTDGDVLVSRADADTLRQLIPAGSRVEIFGSPAPPTPTPIPTPTPAVSDLVSGPSSGEFRPCPDGTFGSQPNCYRIVERLTVEGPCEDTSASPLEGRCVKLAGDPVITFEEGTTCEGEAALELIGDRCYVVIGPIPRIPTDCPPGSRDVEGECREPA